MRCDLIVGDDGRLEGFACSDRPPARADARRADAGRCKSCGAAIRWIKTVNGKNHPLDAQPEKRWVLVYDELRKEEGWSLQEAYTSHFATCPHAAQHRRHA